MFDKIETHYDEHRKIWTGAKQKQIYGNDLTLGEVALYELGKVPEKVIQISDTTGEKLTAAELVRNSKLVAFHLQKLGLQIGDVVGICAGNTKHLGAVIIGSWLCGTTICALYPQFDKEIMKSIYSNTTPKIVFCDYEALAVVKETTSQIKLDTEIVLMDATLDGMRNVEELLLCGETDLNSLSFPCAQISGDDTAVILCSSGTTGLPKGVNCSHTALANMQIFMNLTSESVMFTFSTMHWATGLWVFIAAILHGLKRIITTVPFTPEYFLQLVDKYSITHTLIAAYHIAQVVLIVDEYTGKRLSSIRAILCGGAKVSQDITQKMRAIFDGTRPTAFTVAYGMSELNALLSHYVAAPGEDCNGSVGKLLPNREVQVFDETGKPLGINEHGILHVRLPSKWSGYYGNPDATKTAYVHGWFDTGDIGYFDAQGYLYICSRVNDVIKTYHYQVYPEQIEDVILQLPGVLEVCVFGMPDLAMNKLVACAIVRSSNAAGKELTAETVESHVIAKMAPRFHIKAGVHFLEELPKTASHKVQRRIILDIAKSKGPI